jgi:hypothetical protein
VNIICRKCHGSLYSNAKTENMEKIQELWRQFLHDSRVILPIYSQLILKQDLRNRTEHQWMTIKSAHYEAINLHVCTNGAKYPFCFQGLCELNGPVGLHCSDNSPQGESKMRLSGINVLWWILTMPSSLCFKNLISWTELGQNWIEFLMS